MDGGSWHCTADRDQDHPQEKEMQKSKWLSEEALQIAVKKRNTKSKGEKERYTHLNRMGKTRDLSQYKAFSYESALCIRGQSIGTSASVLPMNIQGWFPLGLTGLISLLSKGTLKSLLQHHNSKALILQLSAFFMIQLSHLYMTTGKTIALTRWTFVIIVMSLLF